MEQKLKNFKIKLNKKIPVDEFLEKALYEPNIGYYNDRMPFGVKGDFITSPTIILVLFLGPRFQQSPL